MQDAIRDIRDAKSDKRDAIRVMRETISDTRYARSKMICTEERANSAFQGTCGFYALLREMPYCQYIELKEKASRDLEFMLL